MKKKHTVIFDLDGTLLDTLGDLSASVNHALARYGLPLRSRQEVRSFLGNGIRYLMERAVGEGVPPARFEEIFTTFRSHYVDHCMDTTAPYAGIMNLLGELKRRGVSMAIVSNKLDPAVQQLNRRFFADSIGTAVGESATVRRKPNPDAVVKALAELGAAKEEAIYVGDSEVDLATARRAGIDCALCLWGFRDEGFLRSLEGADCFLREPADLLQVCGI